MSKVLEDLWFSCEMQNRVEQNEEKKELLELIVNYEKKIQKDLTEEQKAQFKKYGDCISDLHCITECEAFIRGIRFATAFLIEALEKG